MTNSISASIPTSVPGVNASAEAFPLAERFFSCPYAAKLLKSERFIKPLYIDSKNILGAHTEAPMLSSDYIPLSATISIPEKTLQTTQGLRSLAFEIFNAKKTAGSLYQQAGLGDLGMDSYAIQKEEREMADSQEHFALMKKCRNHWKMPPEELRQLEEFARFGKAHPEMQLFNQEIWCHTDSYRQEWIQLGFQKIYCKKRPGAKRSCGPIELCNYAGVKSMSVAEKAEFERGRVCKLFPEAHVKVKDDPRIRRIVEEKCPELLEKSYQPKQEEL